MKFLLLFLSLGVFSEIGRARDSQSHLLEKAEVEANAEMMKWLEQIQQSLEDQSKKLEKSLSKSENKIEKSALRHDFLCHYFQKRVQNFKEEAEKGDVKSQYYLGLCYLYGVGVSHNDAGAEKWFSEAAKQGHPAAKKELQDLQSN